MFLLLISERWENIIFNKETELLLVKKVFPQNFFTRWVFNYSVKIQTRFFGCSVG